MMPRPTGSDPNRDCWRFPDPGFEQYDFRNPRTFRPGTRFLGHALIMLLILLAAGCNLTPQRNDRPIQQYDLGSPPVAAGRPCCAGQLALAPMRATAMLSTQAMWYRRGAASVQPQSFAVSRWSAPPAALIEQYVRLALAMPDPDRREALPFRLALKVEAMEQQFGDREPSSALLVVSATLTRTSDRRVLANQVFRLSQPAPEESPRGGALAFAQLAAELASQLQDWVCGQIDATATSCDRVAPA